MNALIVMLAVLVIANLAISIELHKTVGKVDNKITTILTEAKEINQKLRKYDEIYTDIKNKAILATQTKSKGLRR